MDSRDRDRLIDRFRHGDCYPMAAAMSDRLGWPIRALMVDVPSRGGWGPHVVHAWVTSPDGRACDAGGGVTDEEVVAEYLHEHARKFREPRFATFETSEAFLVELRKCFGNDAEWPWYVGVFGDGVVRARAALDEGLLEIDGFAPAPSAP